MSRKMIRTISMFVVTCMMVALFPWRILIVRADQPAEVHYLYCKLDSDNQMDLNTMVVDPSDSAGMVRIGLIARYGSYTFTDEDENVFLLLSDCADISVNKDYDEKFGFELSGTGTIQFNNLTIGCDEYMHKSYGPPGKEIKLDEVMAYYNSEEYGDDREYNYTVTGDFWGNLPTNAQNYTVNAGATHTYLTNQDPENGLYYPTVVNASNVDVYGSIVIKDHNATRFEGYPNSLEINPGGRLNVHEGGKITGSEDDACILIHRRASYSGSIDLLRHPAMDGSGWISYGKDIEFDLTTMFGWNPEEQKWYMVEEEELQTAGTYSIGYDACHDVVFNTDNASVKVNGELKTGDFQQYEFEAGVPLTFELEPPFGREAKDAVITLTVYSDPAEEYRSIPKIYADQDPVDNDHIIRLDGNKFTYTPTTDIAFVVNISWSLIDMCYPEPHESLITYKTSQNGKITFSTDNALVLDASDPQDPTFNRRVYDRMVFDNGQKLGIYIIPDTGYVVGSITISEGDEEFVTYSADGGVFPEGSVPSYIQRNSDGSYTYVLDHIPAGDPSEIYIAASFEEDPNPTPTKPDVKDFVERLYTVALGRPSEPEGKAAWIDAIVSGRNTGAEAARGFIYSKELTEKNLGNEEFVKILYNTFFEREADAEGLAAWVSVLDNGGSREEVVDGFINSTEWANLCLDYGILSGGTGVPNKHATPSQGTVEFCTRLYSTCLGREGEESGIMAWAQVLADQKETGTGAAHGFFFSTEFTNQSVSNSEYVSRLYRTFMDREPDQAGFDAWVGQLDSGVSREEVFNGFAQSTEFSKICAEYGIRRG